MVTHLSQRGPVRGEPTYVPRSDDAPLFGFAPFDWTFAVCVSRAGRPRKAHDFDRHGICHWCDFDRERPVARQEKSA